MPLEVRELIVRVNVGSAEPAAPAGPGETELAALKREVVEACLAELRRLAHDQAER